MLYSLEPLTFASTLEAQSSQYALFLGQLVHFLRKIQKP